MPVYNEEITLHSTKLREFFNITSNIKAALEKSGFADGLIVVSSLHSNSAVFVNDDEPGLLEDLEEWLDRMAPAREDYKHEGRFESKSAVHLQALLLNHQAIVAFTNRRLDLGPWQFVIYADLDGQRPKRILVKVIGE
ncbi:MAG: secondary thiamine-phosphate synthase enzyme YjbQ [Candidatus Acidiferrales bacterium]